MAKKPTILTVVAAAIADDEGRWLLQQRPAGKRHGGLWEFPGGKVEPGETPRNALLRELNEELTITAAIVSNDALGTAFASAGEGEPAIAIMLYKILTFEGFPVPEAGARIGWFTRDELSGIALAPLDVELARHLPEM